MGKKKTKPVEDKAPYDVLPVSGDIADFVGQIFYQDCFNLLPLLPDNSVDMILTDPPYQVTQAHYDQHALDLDRLGKELFRIIKPSGAVISTAAQPFTSDLVLAWRKYFRYEWIWRKTRKTNFLNAPYEPLTGHESILVFGLQRPDYYPQKYKGEMASKGTNTGSVLYRDFIEFEYTNDEYYPDTVLEFPHDPSLSMTGNKKEWNHPNQKPLAMWEFLLKSYTLENDIVLDCFSGSGTTAITGSNLGRRFICCDSHEPYVIASRERLRRNLGLSHTTKTGKTQLSLLDLLEKKEG